MATVAPETVKTPDRKTPEAQDAIYRALWVAMADAHGWDLPCPGTGT